MFGRACIWKSSYPNFKTSNFLWNRGSLVVLFKFSFPNDKYFKNINIQELPSFSHQKKHFLLANVDSCKIVNYNLFKEAMSRYWLFAGNFLSLRKLMLQHLKSMWQIISRYIMKKMFQRRLKVLPHKQTLLCNMYIKDNCFTFFFGGA